METIRIDMAIVGAGEAGLRADTTVATAVYSAVGLANVAAAVFWFHN